MALLQRAARAVDEPPAPRWGWGRWFWRSLTSMRTAVILLTLMAVAAIPGSVLPQRNVASDPVAVATFVADNPEISPWLDRFGLFDVYASPWFAAIYLLLLVSMTGCVLPRSAKLWRAVREEPPPAPRHLGRLEHYSTWPTDLTRQEASERAATVLRRRRFRVRVSDSEVRSERGYVREVGNLVFHLSLLVLLVGIGAGRLFGYEARVAVVEGGTFANVQSQHDAFTPSVWTDVDGLEPVSFTLDDFDARYALTGPNVGEPRGFTAALSYRAGGGEVQTIEVSPNNPLDVDGTKFFLTGHGYAPQVTVRDGTGTVVSSGPVIFLPTDPSFSSDGVIKAPDAQPEQLAFEGLFLPTAATGPDGPFSQFPDVFNPELALTALTGDLGLNDGDPQSVFSLDRTGLDPVLDEDGLWRRTLSVGETVTLPDGLGSVTFDGVSQFANFQIAYDPGKEISLVAALLLLFGLTISLTVGRRQVWMRHVDGPAGRRIELAARSVTRRSARDDEMTLLRAALDAPPASTVDPMPRPRTEESAR
jgi:cytochrome c biogenesis protein